MEVELSLLSSSAHARVFGVLAVGLSRAKTCVPYD